MSVSRSSFTVFCSSLSNSYSHHIFIPRITLPNDIQYLAEYIPTCKDIVPHLKKYEFFEYEFDSEEQNTVKLDLATDTLEIV